MTTEQFLQSILPETGAYCITTIDATNRNFVRNTPFNDLQSASQYAMAMAQTADVYMALSSYSVAGKFSRTVSNALRAKSFWLDLDCDSEKATYGQAYANKQDAIQALGNFLKATKLPVPALVDSGYGYHVYWPLSQSVTTAQWKQLSFCLRALCQKYSLLVDHHRTCDAASILRVPGSINHKRGTTAPVVLKFMPSKLVDTMAFAKQLLSLSAGAPAMGQAPQVAPSVAVPTVGAPSVNANNFSFSDDFGNFKNMPPRDWKQMVIKCKQIREMGSSSYPAWMLAARTMLCTNGGPAMIHALSKRGATKYDYASTEKLINSLQQREDIGAGTCATFGANCPSKCEGCPYKGKIKSPISLAGFATPKTITMPAASMDTVDLSGGEIALGDATETVDVHPFSDGRFTVIPGKGVFASVESPDGSVTNACISNIEVYIHTLCIDNTQGLVPKRTYIMRKIAPGCAPVDIPFAIEDALGTNKLEVWTAQCGMLPLPANRKLFFEFMNTYIATLQNNLPEVYVRNHFGWDKWTDKATGKSAPAFIVGTTMYTADGSKKVRLDERAGELAKKLGTRGNLEDWKKVPALYKTLDQKFAQLLMCTAFGAPLMQFGRGTATNVAYNFWDINGGKGKSSILKAIASVWGDPQQMLMGRTDTTAARFQHFSVFRNLPVLIDEITGMRDSDAATLLYDIVNGREKARSTVTGTGLAQSGHWDTIAVFTANQSMYEALKDYRAQTSATCMRVIEAVCDFKDYSNTEMQYVINDAMTAARDNYGLAGHKFIEFLMRNPKATDTIAQCAERFATKYAKASDERFWLYGMAIPLYAGRVAKAMGLLDYDMDALERYCIEELLPSLRAKVKSNKPTSANLLMEFMNDNLSAMLVVGAHTRADYDRLKSEGKIKTTTYEDALDPYIVKLPRDKLHIRRELDTGATYVSVTALTHWCKNRGISVESLLDDIRLRTLSGKDNSAYFGLDQKRVDLGAGYDVLSGSRQRAYKFKIEIEDKPND